MTRTARLSLLALCVFSWCALRPGGVRAAAAPVRFALIADMPYSDAEEPAARALLDAIAQTPKVDFIVDAGNLKSPDEPCTDTLYQARLALLDATALPLVYVPGDNDWAQCTSTAAGGYDAAERLDFLREKFFPGGQSLGQRPLDLIRQSDIPRFRPYRENVRWEMNDVMFVVVNAPADNNHYLYGGGRNAEFEDRSVANRYWLDSAAARARRAHLKALVIILQGDPHFNQSPRHESFAWLRFNGHHARDGFAELKHDLLKAVARLNAPVLVLHTGPAQRTARIRRDKPLKNAQGAIQENVTRVEVFPDKRLRQWVLIEIDPGRRNPFHVGVHDESRVAAPDDTRAAAPQGGGASPSTQ